MQNQLKELLRQKSQDEFMDEEELQLTLARSQSGYFKAFKQDLNVKLERAIKKVKKCRPVRIIRSQYCHDSWRTGYNKGYEDALKEIENELKKDK